jgi:DNA mismatch repair protein MutS
MGICAENTGFGMAYCDISTGEFATTSFDSLEGLMDEYIKILPVELIICPEFAKFDLNLNLGLNFRQRPFNHNDAFNRLCEHFGVPTFADFGPMARPAITAAGGLLGYLQQTQFNSLSHIIALNPYNPRDFMSVDKYARRNLELFKTYLEGELHGSLFWVMDATLTPPGRRLLRKWMNQPLLSVDDINTRLEAVGEYKSQEHLRGEIRKYLSKIGDLERFCAKIAYKRTNGRDILKLAGALAAISDLLEILKGGGLTSRLNTYFAHEIDPLEDIYENISGAISEDAPTDIDSGGIFANGYNSGLDELRAHLKSLKCQIEEYARAQRDELGIKSLKIGQNRVFGYYIELPNSQRDKVPADYLPRQSLVGAARYSTEALKLFEIETLDTKQKIADLEFELFMDLQGGIASENRRILATAQALAHIDALQSLGEIAQRYDYTAPQINDEGLLEIDCGRHPVIERLVPDFVPNDLYLNNTDSKIAIITGPNMAGKSTFMRQVALIAVMAQMGSYVPAKSAKIPVFDAIFTRVGAADDLSRGQSTFMVEMHELAHILGSATAKSLILLDEVGRGTGTTDGLSIAMATIEHIADKIGAKTMFATHYHELTAAESWVDGVVNLSMSVEKHGDGIKFLWKVAEGGTNKSHGIFVAEMAGLPPELVKRSSEIHEKLILQGFFDEDVLARNEVVDYRFVREKIKRYRLFLEEYGEIIEQLGLDQE